MDFPTDGRACNAAGNEEYDMILFGHEMRLVRECFVHASLFEHVHEAVLDPFESKMLTCQKVIGTQSPTQRRESRFKIA